MALSKHTIRWQLVVLISSFLIVIVKFLAYWYTHSTAIFSDALESIVNVITGAFGLYSILLATIPKDENHPYGHGKIEFISAALEGLLITIAGIAIILKAIYNGFYPVEMVKLDLGIYLSIATAVVNYIIGYTVIKQGKIYNSATLIASGEHVRSDAYSTFGVCAGLIAVIYTRTTWIDLVIAMLFGGMITYIGIRIVRRSSAALMDEADYQLLTNVVAILKKYKHPEWIDIHNLRIIKYGINIHIDCHLTLPWYLNLVESHAEVEEVEQLIQQHFEHIEIFIHTDPCIKDSCQICLVQNCPLRQQAFLKEQEWNLECLLKNKKHTINSVE